MAKNSNNLLGLTPEQAESERVLLENSYEMYERTKQETERVRKNAVDKSGNRKYTDKSLNETLKLMETMQKDIVSKYVALGGNPENLGKKTKKVTKKSEEDRRKKLEAILKKELEADALEAVAPKKERKPDIPEDEFPTMNMDDIDDESEYTTYAEEEEKKAHKNTETKAENLSVEPEKFTDHMLIDASKLKGSTIKYDVIPLPSKGECYKSKISKIPVAYLTAYDENLIISPNLYRDGTFLDYLLKSKVMTDLIETDDLLPGDRDAIILWLRGSGYGPEYPVTATDAETGKAYDSIVNLTEIKPKEFNLKGDENGYFDFELPLSKDKIKFKFLSFKDIRELEKLEEIENKKLKKDKLSDSLANMRDLFDSDTDMDRGLRLRIGEGIKAISEYIDTIEYDNDILYSHLVTNKMAASIVAINNITDRKYIDEYVSYMNVRDSSAFRKYINANEPGLDFNVTVEKPKELGGGSDTFPLTLDQFIFLNVAQ